MPSHTKIEWTDATWNPVTGCTKVSPGCANCYAKRMAERLQAMGQPKYANGFQPTVHYDALKEPLGWKRPRRVFVCSMSDLFHEQVPAPFIDRVFDTMYLANWHIFQVLTKRAVCMALYSTLVPWPKNIWAGVTVENGDAYCRNRLAALTRCNAQTRFLSLEPLLSALPELDLTYIDWVIVGGESGPGARLVAPWWVRDIRDQCLAAKVPFFFKQWGGPNKKAAGRELDGRTWDEMPPC